MKTKLSNLWQNLSASYWFLPSVISLGAAIAAPVALYLFPKQRTEETQAFGFDWLNVNTGEGARELLATISGSTITLGGVIFSVTIVALSFASSQYGPRLLRNFMRDRSSQVVLGTFLGTYLYCLLVLRTVGGSDSTDQLVPHAAIGGALLFSLASLGMLIYFIHHVARSIQVSSMVAGVGADLDDAIAALGRRPAATAHERRLVPRGTPRLLRATRPGYVQALAEEALLECAVRRRAVIRLHIAAGDYVICGQPLATLSTLEAEGEPVDCADELRDCVIIGSDRSNEQDIEFPIDQLAEMAVRALSRSKNDFFTAVLCINRVGSGLAELAALAERDPLLRDSDGNARVELLLPSFERMLLRAFAQTLAHADGKPVICRQIMKALAIAASQAVPSHHKVILDFALRVRNAANPAIAAGREISDIQILHEELQSPRQISRL